MMRQFKPWLWCVMGVLLGVFVLRLQADDPVVSIERDAGMGVTSRVAWTTLVGRQYMLESSTNLVDWTDLLIEPVSAVDVELSVSFDLLSAEIPMQFYRVRRIDDVVAPDAMALIDAEESPFEMGNPFPDDVGAVAHETPVHLVQLSSFRIDRTLVTGEVWSNVYNWAVNNGYTFTNAGAAKGVNHPIHSISWYDAVKWCNARSEFEGLEPAYYTSATFIDDNVYREDWITISNLWVRWDSGYRLPTEAEWEKAARGGVGSTRFWWGDEISHAEANYDAGAGADVDYNLSSGSGRHADVDYNLSSGSGRHPDYHDPNTGFPNTNPVDDFAANAYGLHDMPGNLLQWCWDWYSVSEYAERYAESETPQDPRGPETGARRILRGASWNSVAAISRLSNRSHQPPQTANIVIGFRTVLPVSD